MNPNAIIHTSATKLLAFSTEDEIHNWSRWDLAPIFQFENFQNDYTSQR